MDPVAAATEAAKRAVMEADVDALRAALAAGADPEVTIPSPDRELSAVPLLNLAASHGHLRMCELLVAAGANANALTVGENLALPTLASTLAGSSDKHLACMRYLLEAGADPDGRIYACVESPPFTSPILHAAVMKSKQKALQLLIEKGASLELKNSLGVTGFYMALFEGNREIALTLLRAGAVMKVLRRHQINDTNAPLHDFLADVISDGGWAARVQRHRDRLLGVISRCVRLPHDVQVSILGFWSPPGGR
jgi:ankyrin repeat protein